MISLLPYDLSAFITYKEYIVLPDAFFSGFDTCTFVSTGCPLSLAWEISQRPPVFPLGNHSHGEMRLFFLDNGTNHPRRLSEHLHCRSASCTVEAQQFTPINPAFLT